MRVIPSLSQRQHLTVSKPNVFNVQEVNKVKQLIQMTTSTLTFTHTEAEFTIYTDGSFEQTDGCDLNDVQTAKYTNYIKSVAAEFAADSDDDDDDDSVVIVKFYVDGHVYSEYFGDDYDDFSPYRVPEFA